MGIERELTWKEKNRIREEWWKQKAEREKTKEEREKEKKEKEKGRN